MATIAGMSGTDITSITSELSSLLPLWIGKIYQYDSETFGIRLNGENKNKHLLYIVNGIRAHLVTSLPNAPKNPSGYSMYLRKYIEGGKILSITQKSIERVIIVSIGKGPHEYKLIIELFDKGNVILTDKNYVILNALIFKKFRNREITQGTVYSMDDMYDPSSMTYDDFLRYISQSNNDLVHTLATKMSLGGISSEEICAISGISKNMPLKFANECQLRPIYDTLIEYINKLKTNIDPVIDSMGVFPIPSVIREPKKHFPTFSAALEEFYPKPIPIKTIETTEKLSREARIRKSQEEGLIKFENKIQEYTEISEIIYSHYTEVQEIIQILNNASSKMSWQDIEKRIKDSNTDASTKIVSVNPSDASVVVNLNEKHNITIFIHENIEQNIGRYYQL
ncbi:MAG TPA: NFACT family protein, partial [Methanocorpusculum sp.]|nr:NFACT family protein [Methanocorpusculum sp.]